MVKQNTTIKLKPELIQELKKYGQMGDHWSDVIEKILELAKHATTQTVSIEFKTAIVDAHGKATISRTLTGKTIEYRIKEE